MNKVGIGILSFIFGAGAGFGVSFFVNKHNNDKALMEQANKFEKEYKKMKNESNIANEKAPESPKKEEPKKKTADDICKEEKYTGIMSKAYTDYSTYAKKSDDIPNEDEEEDEEEDDEEEEPVLDDFEVLTDSQYQGYRDSDEYDIVELTLYKDGYLVDDAEEIVADSSEAEKYVGDTLKFFTPLKNVFYVANNDIKTLYVITRDPYGRCYKETEDED